MGAAEKLDRFVSFVPAGMSWAMALAYTGVGEAQMRDWQKRGLVRFRARGPKGGLVTTREMLDEALRQLFAGGGDVTEDMDFGDE